MPTLKYSILLINAFIDRGCEKMAIIHLQSHNRFIIKRIVGHTINKNLPVGGDETVRLLHCVGCCIQLITEL